MRMFRGTPFAAITILAVVSPLLLAQQATSTPFQQSVLKAWSPSIWR
ncbi:MAG: hypothetical protein ABI616_15005 [Pseudomonadota bacterium]